MRRSSGRYRAHDETGRSPLSKDQNPPMGSLSHPGFCAAHPVADGNYKTCTTQCNRARGQCAADLHCRFVTSKVFDVILFTWGLLYHRDCSRFVKGPSRRGQLP
jgi:hypothetical protein